jgi:hypothetical protein
MIRSIFNGQEQAKLIQGFYTREGQAKTIKFSSCKLGKREFNSSITYTDDAVTVTTR